MDLIREDWCNAEVRKQLILRFKDAAKELMPFAHQKEVPYLNESHPEVVKLCELLEIIFFHGIKVREFHGQIPFWGLLERLEIITPPSPSIRNSVGAISCIPNLRTPLGKARGWIRQSLNTQGLEDSLQFFMLHINSWIIKFYSPEGFLTQKEDISLLLTIIRSLKIFNFNLKVDENSLNSTTPVIMKIIQIQLTDPTMNNPFPTLQQSPASSSATTGANNNTHRSSSMSSSSSKPSSNSGKPASNGNNSDNGRRDEGNNINYSNNNDTSYKSRNSSKDNTNYNNSNTNNQSSGTIDSFIKSFEYGFDKIIHSVDNFLTTPNDPNSIQSEDSYSGKRITPLFGSSLRDLLIDEQRCPHAHLNPELGIPTQILKLITYIHHFIQTPNLFRQRISVHQINELKKSLELEQGIPSSCNIAAVSFVLIQWLNQLPEPLLGFDHYSAILACSDLEDVHHRIRNLSLLVLETSWYNKPLLLAMITLLNKCLLPENMTLNNLNHIAISVLCTPFLLRPPYDKPLAYLTTEEIDRVHMAATAAGSHIIEFLVDHYENVFQPIKEELQMKQLILTNKCLRIRTLQESLAVALDINDVQKFDSDKLQLIYHLWNLLANAEKALAFNSSSSQDGEASPTVPQPPITSPSQLSMTEILQHQRWAICGLKIDDALDPLTEFNAPLGLIALQCFVTFMKKYEMRATNMVVEFQLNRKKCCRLAQVVQRLAHFTADILYLFPPAQQLRKPVSQKIEPFGDSLVQFQYLSKTIAWPLLSDDKCFQEVFDISFLCFDEAWKNLTERIGELPSTETFSQALFKTRAILWEIISRKPLSVQQVWEHWVNIRLLEEEKIFQMNSRLGKTPQHSPLPTKQTPGRIAKISKSSPPPTSANVQKSEIQIEKGKGKSKEKFSFDDDSSSNEGFEEDDDPSDYGVSSKSLGKSPPSDLKSKNSQLIEDIKEVLDSSSDDEDLPPKKPTPPQPSKSSENLAKAMDPSSFLTAELPLPPPPASIPVDNVSNHVRDLAVNDGTENQHGYSYKFNSDSAAVKHYHHTGEINEYMNVAMTAQLEKAELGVVWKKTFMGITTNIYGGSKILTLKHINQLEAALPATHQCYDWKLVYRLSLNGASLTTLLSKGQNYKNTLLVVQDSKGGIFGVLITDALRFAERDKYYGSGTMGVWSFTSGSLQYYPWSFKNSYFIISSRECLAFGGGGSFALYLDADLNRGSSGQCQTFMSPCLASEEEFQCISCELFAFQATSGLK